MRTSSSIRWYRIRRLIPSLVDCCLFPDLCFICRVGRIHGTGLQKVITGVFRNPAIRLAVFYAVTVIFILLNMWFVVKRESMLLNMLPFALILVLLAIFSMDRVLKLTVFFTPLSLQLSDLVPGLSFDMYIPTEPLLFGILILFLLRVAAERNFDGNILRHPVSWAIWLYLFWILISSVLSTMPVVSFKFLMVRIWFIAGILSAWY
jgi:putative inorganic carbon (hco3(-)) transporter